MKTTIATIAIIVLSVIFNINSAFAAEETVYRNETREGNVKTVTLCKGEEGKNLTPFKKYVINYDDLGNIVDKTVYENNGFGWNPVQKFVYEYTSNGQVSLLSFLNWDDAQKSWKSDKRSVAHNKLYIKNVLLTTK